MTTEKKVAIRLIEAGDILTGLSLGDAEFTPLKTFLQKHAKSYQAASLARTYGAFIGSKVIGYITLVCGEIALEDGDNSLLDGEGISYGYRQYPAVKIARLAVDKRYRETGVKLGTTLVHLALGIVTDSIAPAVGCRFVVVDSKSKSVAFYNKVGFTMLETPTNKQRSEPLMFVDLLKAAT